MKTWLDLEVRFRKLSPELKRVRIDSQTGAAGEYWNIFKFDTSSEVITQFEYLCHLAGQKIMALNTFPENIVNHNDSKIIWYRLMANNTKNFQINLPAFQEDQDGNHTKAIFSGSLNDVGSVAANLCLQLEVEHPLKPKWYVKLYQDHLRELINGTVLIIVATIIAQSI